MSNRLGGQRVASGELSRLQEDASRVRNVCILAHVDHGKTTLSDGLVCSNGIISSKLAGKLRYLDSTEDEQKRGITMHSSAISLLYSMPPKQRSAAGSSSSSALKNDSGEQKPGSGEKKPDPGGPADDRVQKDNFLINLIDSPGHIDFSSDVSTATRLCDCGLIVVDVLEGVCAQTHAVFRQARAERMRPLLVLNKIDRLASELQLTPLEAWHHLQRLVENVNALTATLTTADELADLDEAATSGGGDGDDSIPGGGTEASADGTVEEEWIFSPENGCVVFCSALDGWGFGLGDFARIWAKRVGCKPKELRKMLWGSLVFNAKTKKVTKWTTSSASPPMFVSMILEPIWQLYDAAVRDRNGAKTGRMALKLGLDIPPRELESSDPRTVLQSVMKRWLPLSEAVLRMVAEQGPSPVVAQANRVKVLWPQVDEALSLEGTVGEEEQEQAAAIEAETERITLEMERVRLAVATCDSSPTAPVVIFVSKMVPVKRRDLTNTDGKPWRPPTHGLNAHGGGGRDGDESGADNADAAQEDPDGLAFVAFARVLSGTVTPSTPLLVLGPKYHPLKPGAWRHASPLGEGKWIPPIQTPLDGQDFDLKKQSTRGDTGHEHHWTRVVGPHQTRGGISNGSEGPPPVEENMRLHEDGGGAESGGGGRGVGLQEQGTSSGNESVALYMMMGAALHPVSRVPAGNVLALAGLEGRVNKCATLSDTPECPAMRAITLQAKPMVRVAVEALHQQDMDKLELGLSRLYQADPAVEVSVTTRGEHVVCCLGELHLEQSLKDLRERYACVELKASLPLVAFRETVVAPGQVVGEDGTTLQPPQLKIAPWSDEEGLSLTDFKNGRIRVVTSDKRVALTLRCLPSPKAVGRLIENHPTEVRMLSEVCRGARTASRGASETSAKAVKTAAGGRGRSAGGAVHVVPRSVAFRQDMLRALREAATAEGGGHDVGVGWGEEDGEGFLKRTLAFGPRNVGANVLARRSGGVSVHITKVGDSLKESSGLANASGDVDRAQEVERVSASETREASEEEALETLRLIENSVITGFQLATLAGPLAGEEMHHLCFVLEGVEITQDCLAGPSSSSTTSSVTPPLPPPLPGVVSSDQAGQTDAFNAGRNPDGSGQESSRGNGGEIVGGVEGGGGIDGGGDGGGDATSVGRGSTRASSKGGKRQTQQQQQQQRRFGPLSGQIISIVKMGCRASMLCCPVRLVEAFYRCSLQCDQQQLGNMYSVLSKRRGRVIDEDLVEGTQLFLLTALLPVAESFGFANELLKKTSGAGTTPQLAFSHWEVMDMDPFWRPQTSEEREDEGEEGHLGVTNISRQYLDGVRKRKGLATNEKIVVAAEKQRTLTRNK